MSQPFWMELCEPSHLLKLEVGNIPPKDYQFLTGVIELFTDPANRVIADRIRGGRFAVQCNPKDGKPHLVDLSADTPQLPPARWSCSSRGSTMKNGRNSSRARPN